MRLQECGVTNAALLTISPQALVIAAHGPGMLAAAF